MKKTELKSFALFLVSTVMIVSSTGHKQEIAEMEVDKLDLTQLVAEANNIDFDRLSSDSYKTNIRGVESTYKTSNNKLTEMTINLPTDKKQDKLMMKLNDPSSDSNTITNTYTYEEGLLQSAVTNGQHLEFSIESNETEIDNVNVLLNGESIGRTLFLETGEKKIYPNGDLTTITKLPNNTTSINFSDDSEFFITYDDNNNIIEITSEEGRNSRFEYLDDSSHYKSIAIDDFHASFEDIAGENLKKAVYSLLDYSQDISFSLDNDIETYAYDSNVHQKTFTDGLITSLGYNGINYTYNYYETDSIYQSRQLESVSVNDEPIYTYSFDDLGNISFENNYLTQSINSYEYDHFGQLTSWNNGLSETKYTYDLRGNLLEETSEGLTNTFVYDDIRSDVLRQYNNKVVGYDESFNITSLGESTLSYTRGGVLSDFNNAETNSSYKYDVDGMRTSKTVNGITTNYYSELNRIIFEETDGEIIHYLYDKNGSIFGFNHGDENYYYLKNGKNEISAILDYNGNVVVTYEYDPWGKIINVEDLSIEKIGDVNNILYKGYYYDEETSMYYIGNRYYSPEIHRFITRDNVERLHFNGTNDLSLNLYAYASNNPIMKQDFLGYAVMTIAIGGLTIALAEIIAFLVAIVLVIVIAVLVAMLVDTIIRRGVSKNITDALDQVRDKLNGVASQIRDAAAEAILLWSLIWWQWWDNTYRDQFEVHHIIAQSAVQHIEPRSWLLSYGATVNDYRNLVTLKKIFHKHLHTSAYYAAVYASLYPFRSTATTFTFSTRQAKFFGVLATIKAILLILDGAVTN